MTAQVGDELLMMSPEHEHYIGLTEVGAHIWSLVETPISFEELCARLLAEFDATPEQVRTESQDFLKELAKHGAITLDPPAAS
jgi:hypothetical protein